MARLLRVLATTEVIVDLDAWRTEYGFDDASEESDVDIASYVEGDVRDTVLTGFLLPKWEGLRIGLPSVSTSHNGPTNAIRRKGGDTTVTVIVLSEPVRIGNTRNGNPRYRIPTLTRGDFKEYVSMSDAGFVYGIGNGWRGDSSNGYVRKSTRSAVLTLTPAGRVRHMEYLD